MLLLVVVIISTLLPSSRGRHFKGEDKIQPVPVQDTYDWIAAKEELESLRQSWTDLKVNKYVYSLHTSCFCPECWVADKYILIENEATTHVEFDKTKLEENGWDCSDKTDIQTPLNQYYTNIDFLYDKAIAHAQKGIDAMCNEFNPSTNTFGEAICGGGIQYEIHNILPYPVELNLFYGPQIADTGISYTINCLTVYDMETNIDLPHYNDECNEFILSSATQATFITDTEPTPAPIWTKGYGFRDRDYILFTWKERSMSWIDAEQFCVNSYDSHLGSIISVQDWERQYDYSYHGGFIGLNDIYKTEQWNWIDGTQCANNLETCSAQLNVGTVNNDYCTRIPWGGFAMDTFPCDQINNQFFCNKVRGYYVVSDAKTYGEAEDYCKSEYGTHLATIERSGDMKNAVYASQTLDDVWVGLYYVTDENININIWLDGTEYVSRDYIDIDLTGNSHCRSLDITGSDGVIKAENSCSVTLPFLCNKRAKVREFILENQNVTFDEGRNICQTKYDSDLATVITEEEFSDGMLAIPYFSNAWIGLQRVKKKNNKGNFVWVDGTECTEKKGNCVSYWNEYAQPAEPVLDCGGFWQNGRAETIECNDTMHNVLCNKKLNLYEISNEDRLGRTDVVRLNLFPTIGNIIGHVIANNNWVMVYAYIGVLTIVFNIFILVLKNDIWCKNLFERRKEKYIADL